MTSSQTLATYMPKRGLEICAGLIDQAYNLNISMPGWIFSLFPLPSIS